MQILSQKVSPTWYKYGAIFPNNGNLVNVNNMNALNQLNNTLSSFNNMNQFQNGNSSNNGVNNGINGLSGLNVYTSNMNNVAALNAMTMAVNGNTLNGLNLQNLNQGVTGFTPTFEGDRSLGNGMSNLSTNDFVGWPGNFVGIISDAASATYSQQNGGGGGNLVTSNGAANQVNTSFGGMDLSFPTVSNKLFQGGGGCLSNSNSPTNAALSSLTSLAGQHNFFNIQNHHHHQMNSGNGGTATGSGGAGMGNVFDHTHQQQHQQQHHHHPQHMRHDDLDSLKIIPTSGLMMRGANVNVGN